MFSTIFGQLRPVTEVVPRVRAARKRKPLKFAWYDTWNYVHEQLMDPRKCEPGQYSTFLVSEPKGVLLKICCPKGTYMHDTPYGRRGCYDRPVGGRIVASPKPQVLLHDVRKFAFRHRKIWNMLKKQPVKRVRAVTGRGWYYVRELPAKMVPREYIVKVA